MRSRVRAHLGLLLSLLCSPGSSQPEIRHLQLFDLQLDPDERTNLIHRADCAQRVQRLQGLMKQWQARVGDTLELPAENQPPAAPDLIGRERVPDQWQPEWIVRKYFEGTATRGQVQ